MTSRKACAKASEHSPHARTHAQFQKAAQMPVITPGWGSLRVHCTGILARRSACAVLAGIASRALYPESLDLETYLDDPEQLERWYRQEPGSFAAALQQLSATHAEHVLVRAWRARLQPTATSEGPGELPSQASWPWVIALACITGACARLLFLGGEQAAIERLLRLGSFVVLVPLGCLWYRERSRTRTQLLAGVAALAALPFAIFLPHEHSQSGLLGLAHLPVYLTGLLALLFPETSARATERAMFLGMLAEAAIITLALLFGGMLLTGLTFSVFSLIGVKVGDFYIPNVVVPCAAAAPIIAAGLERARAQRSERLGPALARIFSPLALATLLSYAIAVIGTRRNPFQDRNSLAVLYLMLLATAVLVTLMLQTPDKQGPRRGVILLACAIAGLSVAVDALALSAIVYRFASFGFSPNRVAVLGGNVLLFSYLAGLTVTLLRSQKLGTSLPAQRWISGSIPWFGAWAALWVFVLPALFGYR
jgi:hypothetical protein